MVELGLQSPDNSQKICSEGTKILIRNFGRKFLRKKFFGKILYLKNRWRLAHLTPFQQPPGFKSATKSAKELLGASFASQKFLLEIQEKSQKKFFCKSFLPQESFAIGRPGSPSSTHQASNRQQNQPRISWEAQNSHQKFLVEFSEQNFLKKFCFTSKIPTRTYF